MCSRESAIPCNRTATILWSVCIVSRSSSASGVHQNKKSTVLHEQTHVNLSKGALENKSTDRHHNCAVHICSARHWLWKVQTHATDASCLHKALQRITMRMRTNRALQSLNKSTIVDTGMHALVMSQRKYWYCKWNVAQVHTNRMRKKPSTKWSSLRTAAALRDRRSSALPSPHAAQCFAAASDYTASLRGSQKEITIIRINKRAQTFKLQGHTLDTARSTSEYFMRRRAFCHHDLQLLGSVEETANKGIEVTGLSRSSQQ